MHSACPCLKLWGEQQKKNWKERFFFYIFLLFSAVTNINSWKMKSAVSNVVSLPQFKLMNCMLIIKWKGRLRGSHIVKCLVGSRTSEWKNCACLWSLASDLSESHAKTPCLHGRKRSRTARLHSSPIYHLRQRLNGNEHWTTRPNTPQATKPCPGPTLHLL